MSELEAIRRDLHRKRPACTVRAAPVRHGGHRPAQPGVHGIVTGLRALPAEPVRPAPGRIARFHAWRREHYVADQLMRVACIAVGAAVALAVVVAVLVAVASWVVGQLSGLLAGVAGGGGAVVLILLAAAVLSRRRSGGHSGEGWHYGKCR